MTPTDRFPVTRRSMLAGAAASMLWPALVTPANAQTGQTSPARWPSKPLLVVVGYPPGTSPDMLARIVQEPLSKALGVPVVIDNRAGAGGNIGVEAVARATDDHTIGVTGNGPLTTAKALYPKLSYDPAKDLRAISLIASTPFALVGPSTAQASNLKELVALLKAKGDKATYGSIGVGSGAHLLMELLKAKTGLRAVHVPYRGSPAVVTSMLAGEIDAGFMVPSVAMPHVKAGKLRIYGLSTASKSTLLPEYPSIAQELNLPEFDVDGWNAFFGPTSLPEAHQRVLAAELERILQRQDIRQAMFEQGWRAQPLSGTALAAKLRGESTTMNALVRTLGITAE